NSLGDQQRVLELAGRVSAEDVQLFYQLALHGRRDLPLAPDPRGGFEMALLRMLAFRPGTLTHTGPTAPATELSRQASAVPRAQAPIPCPPPHSDPEAASGKSPGLSESRPDSETKRPAAQPVAACAVVAAPAITEAC